MILMKAAMPYLDVIREAREFADVPISAYLVLGKYPCSERPSNVDNADNLIAALPLVAILCRLPVAMNRDGRSSVSPYGSLDYKAPFQPRISSNKSLPGDRSAECRTVDAGLEKRQRGNSAAPRYPSFANRQFHAVEKMAAETQESSPASRLRRVLVSSFSSMDHRNQKERHDPH